MGDIGSYARYKAEGYIRSGEAGLKALEGLDILVWYPHLANNDLNSKITGLAKKVYQEYLQGFFDEPSVVLGQNDYFLGRGKHYTAGYLSKFSNCKKLVAKLNLHPKSKCYKAAKEAYRKLK